MADAGQRGRRATELIEQYDSARVELARIRREAVDQLIRAGVSQNDVAAKFGLTKGRISQIKKAGPAIERIFFGVDHIQVAVPQRPGIRDYVALEDSATGQHLVSLAHSLQLTADIEYIPTTGELDLNRDSLVIVCGPKTSPVTATALAADPRLSFETLEDGRWVLIDRRTGHQFTAPSDDPAAPRSADVAYLGRLPRPDGQGTFLLIAGVHAIGSLGVAHYLAENLADLYEQAGTREFSMVIGADFDPATKKILQARAETLPLVHGNE